MAERPGVLGIGDRVMFEGAEHQVVALAGTSVRLLSDAGQATVVALPFLLAAPDFAVIRAGSAVLLRPVMAPHGLLDALPPHVVSAALAWERHLVELQTGVPPDAPPGTTPRPEYDLARPLAERERAKAAELTAAGVPASARTVRRMRSRYLDQGLGAGRLPVLAGVPVAGEGGPAGRGGRRGGGRRADRHVDRDPDPGHPADRGAADFAPLPGSMARRLFDRATIDAHLDHLAGAQRDDGGWMFNWPSWSPAAEADWRGFLTVDALRVLRANGRA